MLTYLLRVVGGGGWQLPVVVVSISTGEEQSVDLEHFAAAAKVHYARVAKADPHALQVPTCPAPTVSRRHPHPVYP